tara:strand:+ start:4263 stop:4766 length:504 start_codon:yes stop_codon:yes gene_type:complete
MRKIKKIFVITGFPGSGKTSIAKLIKKKIEKRLGTTIVINGDDIRNIFGLKGYSIEERDKLSRPYLKFAKFIHRQNINVILTCVSITDEERKIWLAKNEIIFIHINSNKQKIINYKKSVYKKNKINIPGFDQKIKKPKLVSIFISNNFKMDLKSISEILYKKILLFI